MESINTNSIFPLLSISKLFLKQILVSELEGTGFLKTDLYVNLVIQQAIWYLDHLENNLNENIPIFLIYIYEVDNTVKSVSVSIKWGEIVKHLAHFEVPYSACSGVKTSYDLYIL